MPRRHLFPRGPILLALCVTVVSTVRVRAQPADPPAKPKAETPSERAREDAARAARWLQQAFKGQKTPEAAEMLIAIARGSRMGPGDGWFHPGQSRYGWKWLAEKHGIRPGESIPAAKFAGPAALFARLDRNKDGVLRADDFDWSERTLYAQQTMMTEFWFGQVNKAGDGRLTREEWLKFFDKAAAGKDHLTTDNLARPCSPGWGRASRWRRRPPRCWCAACSAARSAP